jgi:hypothetical protein
MLGERAENLWLGPQGVARWMQIGRINGVVVVLCDKHSISSFDHFENGFTNYPGAGILSAKSLTEKAYQPTYHYFGAD